MGEQRFTSSHSKKSTLNQGNSWVADPTKTKTKTRKQNKTKQKSITSVVVRGVRELKDCSDINGTKWQKGKKKGGGELMDF